MGTFLLTVLRDEVGKCSFSEEPVSLRVVVRAALVQLCGFWNVLPCPPELDPGGQSSQCSSGGLRVNGRWR